MKRGWIMLLLLTAGLVAAGAWLWVPSSLPNEVASQEIARLISRSFPLDVKWKSMEVSMNPPKVSLRSLEFRETLEGPVLVTAPQLWVSLKPGSLEAGAPSIDQITLQEPQLEIDRKMTGWKLWGSFFRKEKFKDQTTGGNSDPSVAKKENDERETVPRFSFTIDRGTAVLVDGVLKPPAKWVIEDVKIEGKPNSETDGYAVQSSARSSSGGKIRAKGSVDADGKYAIEVRVEKLALTPLARYSESLAGVKAPVSGKLVVEGNGSAWSSLKGHLRSPDATIQMDDTKARGALVLDINLAPDASGGVLGEFDLDATGAFLDVAGSYQKKAGSPGRVKGTFVIGPDGKAELDEMHLVIRNKRSERKQTQQSKKDSGS